jgi:hypothetical protein
MWTMLTSIPGATVIAEHNLEALDEPYWYEVNTLFGDGGIIERHFDGSTKEMHQSVGYYVSISSTPDNAVRLCLHLIQNLEIIYDKYVVGVSVPHKRASGGLADSRRHSITTF